MGSGFVMLTIPVVAFFLLIFAGLRTCELSGRQALVFLVIWILTGLICNVVGWPPSVFVAFQAVLDCVLVLIVFGDDIKIT